MGEGQGGRSVSLQHRFPGADTQPDLKPKPHSPNPSEGYHESWLKAHGSVSLQHRSTGAESLVMLDAGTKPRALELLLAMPFGYVGLKI